MGSKVNYRMYELEKQELAKKGLPPAEYEEQLKELIKKWRI